MKRSHIAACAVATALFASCTIGALAKSAEQTAPQSPPQPGSQHHSSNTLTKIGHAIQYTARKDATNLSVDAHKTTHSKSVVRNRKTGNNFVVKPNGHTVLKSTTNPRVKSMHRMHSTSAHHSYYRSGRKYYWYQNHWYSMNPKTGQRMMVK